MRLRRSIIALVGLVVAATQPRPAAASSDFDRWVAERGHLLGGSVEVRAVAVLESLSRAATMPALRVQVLDSADVGAFSWPDGHVVVTAGLMGLLADDELAAALAHEAGHLVSRPDAAGGAGLVGASPRDESEAAADLAGLRLLSQASRDTRAMARMLRKVRAALGPDSATSDRLAHRIELLDDRP